MLLQPLDREAGRRLQDLVGLGAPGETPEADDIAKDLEGVELHGSVRGHRPAVVVLMSSILSIVKL
jgi:hypothetical protein